MDPLNNQPQTPAQGADPNPQTPTTPPPVQPQQHIAPASNTSPIADQPVRPAQNTQFNESFERPVAPWPPASTTSSQTSSGGPAVANPQPVSPSVAQTIGLETAEAAGAVPNVGSAAQPTQNDNATTAPEDVFEPPAKAPEMILPPKDMSDEQANSLFTEEEATKKRDKKRKIKKVVKIVLGLLLSLIVIVAAYIFVIGNSAASSYKNQSSVTAYQDAFTEITESLTKDPVDSVKLSSGINKLKSAEDNSAKLSTVILGDLNPNYKKAKNFSLTIADYKESTKGYTEKYSYPEFITALSSNNDTVVDLQKLNAEAFTTVEDTLKRVKEVSETCIKNTSALKDSAKPSDLGTASEAYYKALNDICSPLEPTIQTILKDKNGALSDADKGSVKSALNGVSNSSTSLINGSGPSSFYINQLTSYVRSALDEATKLKDSADAILKA